MSNVVTVVSAVTGSPVASFNTAEETVQSVADKALRFPEVSRLDYSQQLALKDVLRQTFESPTDQTIRNEVLAAASIDRVEVKVGVVAEAPEESAPEETASGLDVVVNSAVLNAPVAEFNTATETLESLKAGAMAWHEVRTASAGTQTALINTAREVLAATEGKTFTGAHLTAVGIASVVVGDGGNAAVTSDTPVYDAVVAEQSAKAVEQPVAPLTLAKSYVDVPLASVPVTKTVTKWRGLSNKVAAAVALGAAIVGAVIGGSIF